MIEAPLKVAAMSASFPPHHHQQQQHGTSAENNGPIVLPHVRAGGRAVVRALLVCCSV